MMTSCNFRPDIREDLSSFIILDLSLVLVIVGGYEVCVAKMCGKRGRVGENRFLRLWFLVFLFRLVANAVSLRFDFWFFVV